MFKTRDKSESRVIFKKNRHHRNGYVHDDYIAEENEDGYSDDDDVFVEDPTLEISSATKPLMHPRQRTRVKSKHPDCTCMLICKPVLYFVIFVSVLGGLMSAILYTVNKHKHSQEVTSSGDQKLTVKSTSDDIVGCDQIEVEDVWVVGIPKFLTESAFRMVDLNKDDVLDVVMGFGTGVDGYDIPEVVCDIYFQGQKPCHGGVIALEGKTGQVLWKQFSKHELYSLNCNVDLNEDGVLDCLAGGRAGTFIAINGKNGDVFWRYGNNDIMNFYTPQYIHDIDGDKIPDILQIHGGDPLQEPGSKYRLSGKIMLFSGKTGRVIKTLGVPDHKESYYSPQIYTQKDGTQIVLFGTGGETHGGSLWRITLHHLIKGQIHKAKRIYTDNFKGVMTPPVLLDLNKDDVEDIVISIFNSTILAIDGRTFHLIWNYTFINSETYCSPAPGYYNEDEVPDFLVKYQTGPGFPIYYSSETTVLDGKTGQPLISSIKDSIGAQSSPLTISVEGRGNDIFLFWTADCLEHVGQGGKYGFIKGTNVHEQSRSDNCRFRFKTKGFTELLAKSRHVKSQGVRVYYSEDRLNVEHSEWINTTQEAIEFVQNHPEHIKDYDYYAYRASKKEVENIENTRENGDKDDNDNNYQRQEIAHSNRNPMTSSSGKKGGLGPRPRPSQRHRQQNRQKTNQRPTNRGRNQGRFRGDVPGYPYDKQSPFSSYYSNGEEDPEYQRENRQGGRYFDPYDPRYEKKRSQHKTRPLAMAKRSNDSLDDSFEKKIRYILESVKDSGRIKRHIGPHDGEGIQRLISTGTVAPTTLPVDHPDYNHTAEIIFATYWFFPAKTQAILESDQKCIADLLSKEEIRMQPNSKYYRMDHDAYEHAIVKECLHKSGSDQLNNDGRIYESQTAYNPYDVHMGQMTVYRIRLKCSCSEMEKLKKDNKRCSRVLPFEEQEWPSYMGRGGDSHWRPRSGL